MNYTAEVYLWGTRIGIIHLEEGQPYVAFEYDRNFAKSGIEVSPFAMPLSNRIYSFPNLPVQAFHGVPGMLADSLPDKFGNAVINQWLASQGRMPESFNVIERLCYTGTRGMGALEYVPASGPQDNGTEPVDISELVRLASSVLKSREHIHVPMAADLSRSRLLKLGTSAGGARAKAIVAWNEETGDVRSGQIQAGDGYGYWLIKFDGVDSNGDHGMEDEPEYTLIEYAYYLMAVNAGIQMEECRILSENGRNHFMTRRFDRERNTGAKLHMQTLGALAHIDYNTPGLCSYEHLALYAKKLGTGAKEMEQLYRRMVFNCLAVNQDDHVKNFSFLMDKNGAWRLSPAYDITFAYDLENRWLKAHQMTINGKKSGISRQDIICCGEAMDLKRSKCKRILEEVKTEVDKWEQYAEKAGIREHTMHTIDSMIKKSLDTGEKQVYI